MGINQLPHSSWPLHILNTQVGYAPTYQIENILWKNYTLFDYELSKELQNDYDQTLTN